MTLGIKIKEGDPKTLLVLWEGEVWKELSKSLFYNALKKVPSDIDWQEFLSHFSLLEEKIAKRYCVYLLSKRNYLSSALESKLVLKGFSLNVAKAVIHYCCEKGFLEDAEETRRLVAKELRKGLSAKAVFYKLRAKKGVDASYLRQSLQEAPSSDADALQKWLQKNAHKIDRSTPSTRAKLIGKLCRKGFSYELILSKIG